MSGAEPSDRVDALEIALGHARADADMHADMARRMRDALAAEERRVAAIRRSRSWRWTMPLRRLSGSAAKFRSPTPDDAFAPPHGVAARDLDDLLTSHDALFVSRAYVTLLGRQPDSEGHRRYLTSLRQGMGRIHIASDLAASAEARIHGDPLPGLAGAALRARIARTPVIGRLLNLIVRGEGTSATERRLRRIENRLFAEAWPIAAPANDAACEAPVVRRFEADGEPMLDAEFTPRAREIFRAIRLAQVAGQGR